MMAHVTLKRMLKDSSEVLRSTSWSALKDEQKFVANIPEKIKSVMFT